MPATTDVRDCRLYRFYGWDPRTGYTTKTLIYIGETVREPFDRLMEHVARKPWADTITSWEVDDQVFAGKDQVLAAEQAAVQTEQPLYNHEYNLGNPHRVPLSDQERQRWDRDTARGRPLWRAPQQRPMYRNGQPVDAFRPNRSTQVIPERPVSVPRKWTAAQVNTLVWSYTWVLTTAVLWGELARHGSWSQTTNALCASATSALLSMWSVARHTARWKRARRRVRKWLR